MSNTRYITLLDGASMNGELIVIRTNAPVELLKELEIYLMLHTKMMMIFLYGGEK